MTDDRRSSDDPGTPDPDHRDPVSGEPLDAVFEVEHHGEDPEPSGGDDDPAGPESGPPGEDAEFTIDPQLGESLPPQAAGHLAGVVDGSVDGDVDGDVDDPDEWPWGAPVAEALGEDLSDVDQTLEWTGLTEDAASQDPDDDVPGDLGLDAVAVPADDSDDQTAPGPAGWDPPASTDAMFAPDEYAAAAGPGPDDRSDDPVAFGAWHEGLEPFPDIGDDAAGDDVSVENDEAGDDQAGDDEAGDDEAGDDDQPFHPALPSDALPATTAPVGSTTPDEPGPNELEQELLERDDVRDGPPADLMAAAMADEILDDIFEDKLAAGGADHEQAPAGSRAAVPGVSVEDEPADWASFTGEHYIRVTQPDYLELADLGANEPDAAPSAVAASIAGVDSGVVGLEDVVDGPAPEAPAVVSSSPSATDLGLRVLTALGLLVLFAAALVHPLGLTVVAGVLFALAAGEFYAVLVRTGQHPLSLFGLLGATGGLVGTAAWGLGAIPVAVVTTLVAVALYYALTSSHSDPLTDGGLTVMVVAWALLGAFVFPIVDSTEYRWWVAAVVIVVGAMDVGQFFAGRSMGSRPLAPVVSPKKTVEGLLGGAALALVVAVVLSFLGPLTLPSMLALAGATIVLAPLGDLSVSLVKRIIGVKDMGTILPGHGGILDRIDGLLFVVPAAWVIFESMGLLT